MTQIKQSQDKTAGFAEIAIYQTQKSIQKTIQILLKNKKG